MPRIARVAVADVLYHVINRSNEKVKIFNTDGDYRHFEAILHEGKELTDMRIVSYCIMPNHWHFVLQPRKDTDMAEFMHWITTTHVRQRRSRTSSVGHGHLYQGTYKSFPVETNEYAHRLIRYVEQNPLRAKLVKRAEDWQWSSLWRREKGSEKDRNLLASLPIELPRNYLEIVNTIPDEEALDSIRTSVNKGAPFGTKSWTERMVQTYNLGSTLRNPGRPKKIL